MMAQAMMMIFSALVLALMTVGLGSTSVDAFSMSTTQTGQRVVRGRTIIGIRSPTMDGAIRMMLGSTKNDDDFPEEKIGESEYTGDVDWDSEWKKVVAKERSGASSSTERPGKGYYKSDAEIAAIRAANKAQKEMQSISSKLPSMPSASSMNLSSLTGDWRVSFGCGLRLSIRS